MSIRPALIQPADWQLVVSSVSECSAPGALNLVNPFATATWPTANKAIYVPFRLSRPCRVTQLWWNNGTVVGPPNIDCGIYYPNGGKIISTGSTPQGTSTVVQRVDVTDTTLDAGLYYMALAMDANSSGIFRSNTGLLFMREAGCAMETNAFPLPATMTPVAAVDSYLPAFGFAATVAAFS